jgi:hypothetical protein
MTSNFFNIKLSINFGEFKQNRTKLLKFNLLSSLKRTIDEESTVLKIIVGLLYAYSILAFAQSNGVPINKNPVIFSP